MPDLTNRQLLEGSTPRHLLNHTESQRQFLLRQFVQPRPCPICTEPFNRPEGEGADLDAYDLTKAGGDEADCPHCGAPVLFSLPLIGDWYWRIDRSKVTVSFTPKDGAA